MRGIEITGLIALMIGPSLAQSDPAPSFDAASIKLHPGEYTSVTMDWSGPRIRVVAYPLTGLVMTAYDVKFDRISGGPAWMLSDRFDIEALAAGKATPSEAQRRLLLQSLLAERFKLKVHREMKVMSVYALVVGRGGPKFKPSAPEAVFSLSSGGSRAAHMTVVAGSMQQLVEHLSNAPGVDHPVIDKTGLAGKYDYELKWNLQYDASASDLEIPSIFAAVQEQLGLKLEPRKASIEVLVVDHAERPSPN